MKVANLFLVILTFSCYALACSSKNIEQTKPFPVGDYQLLVMSGTAARSLRGSYQLLQLNRGESDRKSRSKSKESGS